MIAMTFQELMQRVFGLYQDGQFVDALELVEREAPHFPDWAARTYFWRMCLAAQLDKTERAIEFFEDAIDHGHWFYQTELSEDPDLAPLRGQPEFERLATISAERQAEVRANAELHMVTDGPDRVPKAGAPLLLVLHGNNSNVNATRLHWQSERLQNWLVAFPQSSQVNGPHAYVWNDREWAEDEIRTAYQRVTADYSVDPDRVVLGGFSMGGQMAIRMALEGRVSACGFIAVGPYLPDVESLVSLTTPVAERSLRGYIIVGDADPDCYKGSLELADRLQAVGIPCELRNYPELRHEYPSDMADALRQALEFVCNDGGY